MHKVNTYLTEMSRFLWENSLLISAPKSSVTLFTPSFHLTNTANKWPRNNVSKRNNDLKALAGTNWGQQKETLLMTYKALGRSIANYAAPVWSINTSKSNIIKIQRAQNKSLWIIIGSHKMSSIDHIHSRGPPEPSFCAISGTMPGYRECLSPYHQDGSSTKGNEVDNLHQTLSNRVTTASKQQERHTPGTAHLICQYSNTQHEG